jgi:hypothetical protein
MPFNGIAVVKIIEEHKYYKPQPPQGFVDLLIGFYSDNSFYWYRLHEADFTSMQFLRSKTRKIYNQVQLKKLKSAAVTTVKAENITLPL